jgi:hypothetical protein
MDARRTRRLVELQRRVKNALSALRSVERALEAELGAAMISSNDRGRIAHRKPLKREPRQPLRAAGSNGSVICNWKSGATKPTRRGARCSGRSFASVRTNCPCCFVLVSGMF